MPRSYRDFTIAFVVAWLVICILSLSITMNSTTSVSAVEANGVGVYWDSRCSNRVSSIEWGTLHPGSTKNVAVYIRNEGEEPTYLTLSTANWNPSRASNYTTLIWDYTGRRMNLGELLRITLTLSVSRYIEGISNFNFDILITGSNSLPGDINGDGKVNILDVDICTAAFGSASVDDPNTPWDETENWNPAADLNNDGIINIFDLCKIAKDYGKP